MLGNEGSYHGNWHCVHVGDQHHECQEEGRGVHLCSVGDLLWLVDVLSVNLETVLLEVGCNKISDKNVIKASFGWLFVSAAVMLFCVHQTTRCFFWNIFCEIFLHQTTNVTNIYKHDGSLAPCVLCSKRTNVEIFL